MTAHAHRGTAVLVDEFLSEWLEQKGALRPSTRLSYEGHINRYLRPHLGSIPIGSLTPSQISTMYKVIRSDQGNRVGPATLRRIHSTLLSALNAAQARGLIESNPASWVELAKPPRPDNATWTSSELAHFLNCVSGDPLQPLFLLLGLFGLRRGEALALRVRDVDLNRGLIRITRSVTKVGGLIAVGDLKTNASRRALAIDQETCQVLGQQMTRILRQRGELYAEDLLFPGDGGCPLDPAAVSRRFDRLSQQAGLPRIRLHDLRHTSASIGLEAGESLFEVSRRLGHSSITVTADVYSHIAPHVAQMSAERRAALVLGPTTSAKDAE